MLFLKSHKIPSGSLLPTKNLGEMNKAKKDSRLPQVWLMTILQLHPCNELSQAYSLMNPKKKKKLESFLKQFLTKVLL
jgi:hypothetical protein